MLSQQGIMHAAQRDLCAKDISSCELQTGEIGLGCERLWVIGTGNAIGDFDFFGEQVGGLVIFSKLRQHDRKRVDAVERVGMRVSDGAPSNGERFSQQGKRLRNAACGGEQYQQALAEARGLLLRPDALPSARVLAAMLADFDGSYPRFIRERSAATRAQILALPWTPAQATRYQAMAAASVAEQQRIEAADSMLFEQYRLGYLSPDRLRA